MTTLLEKFLSLFSIKTYVFCKTLEKYEKELDHKQMNKVTAELLQLTEMHAQKILLYKNSFRRTRYIHREINRVIETSVDTKNTSCEKNCSYCCHWRVEVTQEEAEILISYCEKKKIKIDKTLLQHQASKNFDDAFWKQSKLSERRCVFLSDGGSCMVYKVRPASCRKCLVYSEPIHCKNPENKKVVPLVVLEAELLTSFAWSTSTGRVDLLPKMISRALQHHTEKEAQ